jgi:hypothetical protein
MDRSNGSGAKELSQPETIDPFEVAADRRHLVARDPINPDAACAAAGQI